MNQLYRDGESIDCDLFAEQRLNNRLFNGHHYKKDRIPFRELKGAIGKEAAIRVTENHVNKVVKTQSNVIHSQVPEMTTRPLNMEETHDIKVAELHKSVLEDWKKRSFFKKYEGRLIEEWNIYGEMFTKTWWNSEAGRRLPDLQYIDEDGEVKSQVRFEGDVKCEFIYPFDLIRDPRAETFESCEWVCIKKLVDTKELKAKFHDGDDRLKLISEQDESRYDSYIGGSGQYSRSKDQTLIREYYFRKSRNYPDGYYYIATESGILFKGKLPLGIFPIDQLGFDDISTSPRCSSVIRHIKHNQYSINMMKSKMLEHILKVGDDMIFAPQGSNITKATKLSGLRVHYYTGALPTITQGRTGMQYLDQIKFEESEIYRKANIPEISQEKNAQQDARMALLLSAKQKLRFQKYVAKYSEFKKELYMKVLKLKKAYLQPDAAIQIIGKSEYINISEFKNLDDIGYEICLEGQIEDAESKVGRSLDIQNILQYGSNFSPDQLGMLIRNLPYMNDEEIYREYTIDYDNSINDILALDRGELPEVREYENHQYMINKLTHRVKKSDFKALHPQIQQNYYQKIQMHEQMIAEVAQKEAALKSEMIPTGGALVACDVYVDAVNKKGERTSKRMKLPSDALFYTYERIQKQGNAIDQLEKQQNQVRGEIIDQVLAGQQAQQAEQIPSELLPSGDQGLDVAALENLIAQGQSEGI